MWLRPSEPKPFATSMLHATEHACGLGQVSLSLSHTNHTSDTVSQAILYQASIKPQLGSIKAQLGSIKAQLGSIKALLRLY